MSITCKKAVDYISKKEEGKLSARQRVELWKHLAICSLCRIFSAQNKSMQMAAKESADITPLSAETKKKIADEVLETV